MNFIGSDLSTATVAKINKIIDKLNEDLQFEHNVTEQSIKDNVFIYYASSLANLNAAISKLQTLLQREPNIALIIIDSFSYHFKSIEDPYCRTNVIYQTITSLQSLIAMRNIAVSINFKEFKA